MLTFEPADVRSYGRVVRAADGTVQAIVEAGDATEEQLALRECNSSIYVFRTRRCSGRRSSALEPHNAQGELYLTDAVRDLVERGERVVAHVAADAAETEGVNTRAELAAAAAALRDRINLGHMLAGVTIVDPATTWIEPSVELEPDVVVEPFTVLRGHDARRRGRRDRTARGGHRRRDRRRGAGRALLLPSPRNGSRDRARRPERSWRSRRRSSAKGPRCPTSPISAMRRSAQDTNIGAGSITANFPHRPGQPKGKTTIGDNVRVAVDTMFVAPVTVGDDAWTAAGSVITDDVPDNTLAGFPPRQVNKEGRGGKRDD